MNKFASNKFAGVDPKKFTFGKINISNTYYKLTPKTPVIDILNNFKWKNWGNTDEVPAVYVYEKELLYSVFTNSILSIIEQGKNLFSGEGLDIYSQLYKSESTGFNYVFPYLLASGNALRAISNQWSGVAGANDIINNAVQTSSKPSKDGGNSNPLLSNLVSMGINTALGTISPGWGMEELFKFDNTARQTLPVSFPLYNTGDIEDIYSNLSFINVFSYQNLKNRTSIMTYIPPKIYTVDAKSIGGIYMPAAYVSDFKVESIGTTRRINELKKFGIDDALIPEAYKVTISFTELLSQSANIFMGALGGDKVEVTRKEAPQPTTFPATTPELIQVPTEVEYQQRIDDATQQMTEQFPNSVPIPDAYRTPSPSGNPISYESAYKTFIDAGYTPDEARSKASQYSTTR
jgi:hypothetical protein